MSIYCVYLTTYLGNKLPPFYIGSTSKQKLDNGYRGSVVSKNYKADWTHELLTSPHLFKTKILFECKSREEAFEKEKQLQIKLNVILNPLYINQCIANAPIGLCNKGIKKTPQHVRNMSISQIERYKRIGESPNKGKKLGPRPGVGVKIQLSKQLKGITNSTRLGFKTKESTKQKQRVAALNRPKILCVNCMRMFDKQSHSRYHGDKCSSTLNK